MAVVKTEAQQTLFTTRRGGFKVASPSFFNNLFFSKKTIFYQWLFSESNTSLPSPCNHLLAKAISLTVSF
jgi:hypothetical protein